jgi:DNA-binding SARP family transcriptional activator
VQRLRGMSGGEVLQGLSEGHGQQSTLDFRLLGPIEIILEGKPHAPGGRAEQSLLALLLLNPGQVLPAARLIELLWEEAGMPADPVNALQNRVSKTRRVLAGLGTSTPALATTAGGYRLELPRSAVDVHRFTDALEHARRITDSPAEADLAYEAALGVWRGSALSGLEAEPWAEKEISRLHDLRLAATEERLSLAVASGRQREVLEQIRQLVDEHPLREGMTHLLMRALYLSGRQAEALDTYHKLRVNLDEQLGLEPSPHVRDLEARILRQDPELGLRRPVASCPAPSSDLVRRP